MSSGERTRTPIYGTKTRCPAIERPRKDEYTVLTLLGKCRNGLSSRYRVPRYGFTCKTSSQTDAKEEAQEDASPHPSPAPQVTGLLPKPFQGVVWVTTTIAPGRRSPKFGYSPSSHQVEPLPASTGTAPEAASMRCFHAASRGSTTIAAASN